MVRHWLHAMFVRSICLDSQLRFPYYCRIRFQVASVANRSQELSVPYHISCSCSLAVIANVLMFLLSTILNGF